MYKTVKTKVKSFKCEDLTECVNNVLSKKNSKAKISV